MLIHAHVCTSNTGSFVDVDVYISQLCTYQGTARMYMCIVCVHVRSVCLSSSLDTVHDIVWSVVLSCVTNPTNGHPTASN